MKKKKILTIEMQTVIITYNKKELNAERSNLLALRTMTDERLKVIEQQLAAQPSARKQKVNREVDLKLRLLKNKGK